MGHNASDGSEGKEGKEGNDNIAQINAVKDQVPVIEKTCRSEEVDHLSTIYKKEITPMCVVSV